MLNKKLLLLFLNLRPNRRLKAILIVKIFNANANLIVSLNILFDFLIKIKAGVAYFFGYLLELIIKKVKAVFVKAVKRIARKVAKRVARVLLTTGIS